jgi:hypothetical protein
MGIRSLIFLTGELFCQKSRWVTRKTKPTHILPLPVINLTIFVPISFLYQLQQMADYRSLNLNRKVSQSFNVVIEASA